jgi:hypothetical protein
LSDLIALVLTFAFAFRFLSGQGLTLLRSKDMMI